MCLIFICFRRAFKRKASTQAVSISENKSLNNQLRDERHKQDLYVSDHEKDGVREDADMFCKFSAGFEPDYEEVVEPKPMPDSGN
jgi:hypothetical protein